MNETPQSDMAKALKSTIAIELFQRLQSQAVLVGVVGLGYV